MDTTALIDELQEIENRRNEIMKKAMEPLRDYLMEMVDAMSDVYAVEWTQYTPYFNDGEPCTFSVNSPCVILTRDKEAYEEGEIDDMYEHEFWSWGEPKYRYEEDVMEKERVEVPNPDGTWKKFKWRETGKVKHKKGDPQYDFSEETFNKLVALCKLMESADIFLAAFGDHTTVKVTAESVTTDECDHD